MAESNLPTLYQNIIAGLPSVFAREVFLWASDKFSDDHQAYKAEAFARKVDRLIPTIKSQIDMRQAVTLRAGGRLMDAEQERDLLRFLQARYANLCLGGNITSPMPEFISRKG
jgi:hypothetical protein